MLAKKKSLSVAAFFMLLLFSSLSLAKDDGHFRDGLARDVYVPLPPKRIVSLAPNITEILFALGLGNRVVGVTNYCNYPPEALSKEKVGMLLNPDIEKILSLSSDLVLWVSEGANEDTYDKLERVEATTFIVSPKNLEALFESIILIGEVCRVKENAEKLVFHMKRKLEVITDKTKGITPVDTLFLLDIDPPVSASSASFDGELLKIAGGRNVIGKSIVRYPRIGWEDIVKFSPQVIIIAKHNAEIVRQLKEFRERPAVKATPAFRNNRISLVDGDVVSRMGPRIIEALEIFAKTIHPGVFR